MEKSLFIQKTHTNYSNMLKDEKQDQQIVNEILIKLGGVGLFFKDCLIPLVIADLSVLLSIFMQKSEESFDVFTLDS